MDSQYNPPAVSPASLIGAFHQPSVQVDFGTVPAGSKKWVEMVTSSKATTILDEATKVGTIVSTLSLKGKEQGITLGMSDPDIKMGDLYLEAVFNFFVKWDRKVEKTTKNRRDYLDFGCLSLIEDNGKWVGAHLPAQNDDVYVWVAMPDDPITSVNELWSYVQKVDSKERNYESAITYVPPVTLRSDLKNNPEMEGVEVTVTSPFWKESGNISSAKYSNKFVLNEKGAFMESVSTFLVPTCIMNSTPKEFIIDRPFVFAAGTRRAGVLFSSYVPMEYWNYTPGEGNSALRELNLAPFGTYRPLGTKQESSKRTIIRRPRSGSVVQRRPVIFRNKFLRPKGEKAKTIVFPEIGSFDLTSLKHGDLVYNKEGERGAETWIVNKSENRFSLDKEVDDSGYLEVKRDITESIEDPLDFYSKVTNSYFDQGVTVIEFSPKVHRDLVWNYLKNDPDIESGYQEAYNKWLQGSGDLIWTTYCGWVW